MYNEEGVFMGRCYHSEKEAEDNGDGWRAYIDKRLGRPYNPKEDYQTVITWQRDWQELTSKYNRPVIWIGPEEFYSVLLCEICVSELLEQLKKYREDNKLLWYTKTLELTYLNREF